MWVRLVVWSPKRRRGILWKQVCTIINFLPCCPILLLWKQCDMKKGVGIHCICGHSLLLDLSDEGMSGGVITKKKKRHSLEAGMHYNLSPSMSSYPSPLKTMWHEGRDRNSLHVWSLFAIRSQRWGYVWLCDHQKEEAFSGSRCALESISFLVVLSSCFENNVTWRIWPEYIAYDIVIIPCY